MKKIDLKPLAGYEEDFALWSSEQAALIRGGKVDRVDLEHVAEDIESLGRSDKHHPQPSRSADDASFEWEHQPEFRSRSWASTTRDQSRHIPRLLDDSTSVRGFPEEVFADEYPIAREKASDEAGVYLKLFPPTCPYTIEQVLDPQFLPAGSA